MDLQHHIDTQEEVISLEDLIGIYNIVLYNDDVNTFDWVIESLIELCGHKAEQAEQCALIVHFKGKCCVKKGSYNDLKPICEALLDRGLSAKLED
ncbi:MAG: ATP-dependent Clp protease adaptor ClpS [Flavobacteriales bacterium]|nr:ATP-dependent Clp protease adaptor ClpS [Flavobacteriales bacterium]